VSEADVYESMEMYAEEKGFGAGELLDTNKVKSTLPW